MGGTTGDGESGIRASDAERDAIVARLSAATGDGRLTLEEFSQRMEQATTAKTRAELETLTADLPTDTATTVPGRQAAQAPASWHVSPIGGLSVSGPWRMDRHVIALSLVGGARLDLRQAQLAAPEVTLTKVSLVGGVRVAVPQGVRVHVSGLRLVGGTSLAGGPEPAPDAPIVHIRAFSLVGGVRISRSGPAQPGRRDRLDRGRDRRRGR